MSVNKVILDTEHGQEVLLDVSQDTVSPGTLARGVTATNAAGKKITGIVDLKTKATAISDSVSGKSVVIEKSGDDSLIGLTLYGKTEQFTTTGKNLIDIAISTATSITKKIPIEIEPGDYIFRLYNENGSTEGIILGSAYSVRLEDLNGNVIVPNIQNGVSITAEQAEQITSLVCIFVNTYYTGSSPYLYGQLEKGKTTTPYEPYTGGIASPNPNYPQRLKTIGKSKNLLRNEATSQTVNGVTFTVNEDKSITVSGTADSGTNSDFYIFGSANDTGEYLTVPKGSIASFVGLASSGIEIICREKDTITFNKEQLNSLLAERDCHFYGCLLRVGSGKNVNTTIYPMICHADEDSSYEPYGDDIEVGVYGANLFDVRKATANRRVKITNGNLEWVDNAQMASDFIPVAPNAEYVLNFSYYSSGDLGMAFYDKNKVYISGIKQSNTTASSADAFIFTTPDKCAYLRFTTTSTDVPTEKISLNVGNTVLPYEPYHKQTLSIPTPNGLPAIKVTDPSLATYTDENGNMWCADTIDYERGVYVKRVGEVNVANANVIDWGEGGGGHDFCIPTDTWDVDNYKNRILGAVCTHFPAVSTAQWVVGTMRFSTTNNHGWSGKARIGFRVPSEISTVAKFKEYVGTDCYVQYVLATPIEIPLTQEEIAEFSVLHSNYPFTTILNNYNALMDVKYSLHTQTYIDEADNKVRDLVEQNKSLINDLKRVKANAIVQKVEGESVVVSDSSDDALRGLRLFGKTEQFTTTGAQLANLPDVESIVKNGITWSCKNGVITAKGTSTNIASSITANIYHELPIVADTYYVSGSKGNVTLYCLIENADGSTKYIQDKSFTLDGTETRAMVFCQIENGMTVDEVLYPMLNKGETPLPWEPYTGGIPSPNPNYPQRLKSIGKGKNLLENTTSSKVDNGVTFTVNGDGSITLNGTATNAVYARINYFNLSGKFILNGNSSNNAVSLYAKLTDEETYYFDRGNGVEFEVTEDKTFSVVCNVVNGATLNNYTIYPMIRYADIEDDTYEPYGKDDIEVGVYGGNLFDVDNIIGDFKTEALTNVPLHVGRGKFTLSSNISKNFNGDDASAFIFVLSGNVTTGHSTGINGVWNKHSVTVEADENGYITIGYRWRNTINSLKDYWFMLNVGETALPYESYKAPQTLTALTPNGLPAIPVTDASIATYTDENGQMWCADEVNFERGVYVQKIYEHEFSGTESFELHQSDRLYHYIQNDFVPIYGLCTIGICEADKTQFGGTGFYFVKTNTYSTVDELKAYLKEKYENGNPVKILGILKTPIETPLSEEELTAYRALHSNYPVTTVLNDSGAHMEVKYNADTKNYIDNKFAELQTALIALGGI